MVPLLLLLILLTLFVIALPIFAIFGGSLVLAIGSHLNIIIPMVLFGLAYIAFLAPIAKRNNIKLGGEIGEPLGLSKPIGPEFGQTTLEDDANPLVNISFFNPDQWKQVSTRRTSGTAKVRARVGRN